MKIMAKVKLKVIDAHFHVGDLSKQSLPWLDTTDGSITHIPTRLTTISVNTPR